MLFNITPTTLLFECIRVKIKICDGVFLFVFVSPCLLTVINPKSITLPQSCEYIEYFKNPLGFLVFGLKYESRPLIPCTKKVI